METLYDLLGVKRDATEQEIKKAYALKVRRYTPEKDPKMYEIIRKAYETLINAQSRLEYDESIGYEEKKNIELEDEVETLYDVLGIKMDATKEEIKKSYASKVRTYSPDKEPEMFQKIKYAFEILINDEARDEYDINIKHGEEIREYEINTVEAWNAEDFKTVILQCKKILSLNKNLHQYLYRLSLALYYNNEIDEAIKSAQELVKVCPNEYEYYKHIAMLYTYKEQYTSAESYLINAHELQPLDETVIINLIDIYLRLEKYKKAIMFLQDSIENNSTNKITTFIYYENLIRIHTILQDKDAVTKIIDSIEENLVKDDIDRQELGDKLYEIAVKIFNSKNYEIAQIVACKSKELFEDEYINELYEDIKERLRIHDLYNKLEEDKTVLKEIKSLIYYYIFNYTYDNEEELRSDVSESLRQIDIIIHKHPGQVIRSISVLKKQYTELFEFRRELYEEILENAEEFQIVKEQYEAMDRDFNITLGIYNLVGLWINNDLTEEERDIRFEEVKSQLDQERKYDIYVSVQKIKKEYFKIYELNPKAIDELEEANRTISKTSKSNSSSENYWNIDTSKDDDADGGCALIILGILAITFGPSILGGILTIGGFIIELAIYAVILIVIAICGEHAYKKYIKGKF